MSQETDTSVLSDGEEGLQTGAPVILRGDTLFTLYGDLGPFSALDRANQVRQKLIVLQLQSDFDPGLFVAVRRGDFFVIDYSGEVVMTINADDAFGYEQPLATTASEFAQILQLELEPSEATYSLRGILWYIGLGLGSILLLSLILWLINKGFRALTRRVREKSEHYIQRFHLRRYRFLSVDRQLSLFNGLMNTIRWVLIVLVVYLFIPLVFNFIPGAEGIATKLLGYITNPIKTGFSAFVAYIPSLVTIIIVIVFMRALLRLMRSIAHEVALGKIDIKGFYPDWAMPTFNLLRFIIFIFTFVLVFPLLPGSGSAVFQGVSVFLGLLISLGSQSAISNIISGLVITYMRAFSIGDRVKIGDTVGDVLERSMLVTRLRTIKNEEVTIPNSAIMTGQTVNYTNAEREKGLILNTTVTIGYDVPWRVVRKLLIDAALKTPLIKSNPSPFVLQTSLDDYYVSYQLNAYTVDSSRAAITYSKLHANIQDTFNASGVEIMSPHYRVNRQADLSDDSTVPDNYLDGEEPEHDQP